MKKVNVITNKQNIFCIYVCVDAGGVHETRDNGGISHVLEHMLLKRTKHYTENALIHKLSELGGTANATTDKDATCYYVYTVAENWREAIDILASVVIFPRFDSKELEIEKKIIVEEIHMRKDKFMDCYNASVNTVLHPSNPYCHRVEGTIANVRKFAPRDLMRAHAERYGRFLVLANCPRQLKARVAARIAAKFGSRTVEFEGVGRESLRFHSRVDAMRTEKSQYTHIVTFPSFPKRELRKNAILNFIRFAFINGSFKSRLFYKLRTKLGLVYSVSSSNDTYRELGLFNIEASSAKDDAERILSEILSTLESAASRGLSPEELKFYKKSFLNNKKLVFADEEFRTMWSAEHLFYGCDATIEDYERALRSITNDDIKRVAREVFDISKIGVLSFGRYGNVEKKKNELMKFIFQSKREEILNID